MPMLAMGDHRRAEPGRPRFDHLQRGVVLPPDDHRHPALDDPGLLTRDRLQRVAEILRVVD